MNPVAPTVTAAITVRAATLTNGLTVTPALDDCGTNVCSGQTATASVVGSLLAGHAVRFDVVGSAYAIVTNNLAQPLASTLTVLADSTGRASVIIKANSGAPTQAAQISVTDVTPGQGQQLIGSFTIVQNTDGSTTMTVVPNDATIKGALKGECSSGFVVDYYIYGGTPPYRVTSTFPNAITLTHTPVNTNGGFFEATTNGSCVDPLTFSIVDNDGPPDHGVAAQHRRRHSAGCAGAASGRYAAGAWDRRGQLRQPISVRRGNGRHGSLQYLPDVRRHAKRARRDVGRRGRCHAGLPSCSRHGRQLRV